jgi:RNA polymerase sigma factor (sigma-70 family)
MTNEQLFAANRFEELYTANQGLILDRINKMPNHLRDEGLGNIAFMRAIRSYRADAGIRFSTYLVTVLLNEIRMLLRAESNRTRNTRQYAEGHHENDFVTTEQPADVEERSNQTSELRRVLNSDLLNATEKRIISLRFGLDGSRMTLEEVSRELSIPRSSVAAMQQRAMDKLRTAVVSSVG